MFGVGGQELVLIGLVLLIVFGPARAAQMARDLGSFAYKVRTSMEEFKAELTSVEEYELPEHQEEDSKPSNEAKHEKDREPEEAWS
jgi:sec-independent protein translocase protein TatB